MTKDFTAFLRTGAALLAAVAALAGAARAQDDKDEKKDGDKEETPTIEKKTEGFKKTEGLFTFYTDPKTGDVYMEVAESQLGAEFIAFTYTENGVVEAGSFRGDYRDQRVISIKRYYNRLDFEEESTAYYFDPSSALARASMANISPALVASAEIEAETPAKAGEDGAEARYLAKVNDVFLSEALHQITPPPNPEATPEDFSIGSLSQEKSRFASIRGYPQNVDIIVDYVFENPNPANGGSEAVTDARNLTLKMQHSLIAMPEPGYEPRIDDYRIGYFFDQVTDLTSPDAAPYRDLINRWRLEKKDPTAAVSDPVRPIVWWIENTTPVEYRDTIRDAVLAWNPAFEKAGFSNAIEVKVQPDDAEWDAGDIRYNVLRWTSSPVPPFGGYGPSFSNPRTGEIIGADVMLEYAFITNRALYSEVFEDAGLTAPKLPGAPVSASGKYPCTVAQQLYAANQFGLAALAAEGARPAERERLIKESIYYLMLHEVGHTLGLNHNMKGSILFGPQEVYDPTVTKGAPTASVMEYPALNMSPPGVAQGDYYISRPGPYDDWAIEFGYRPGLDGAARAALLARSTEPGLVFGNDGDDMRAPGAGVDPRVMISDLSSDPVAYAVDRIRLVRETLPKLVDKYEADKSWQSLLRGYFFATAQHAWMGQVISRQIGGVYVDRTPPGQAGGLGAPYTPVPREKQKAAMAALAENVFAADAFAAPDALVRHLQAQRRGFNFYGDTEDPKIHARVLGMQTAVLDHLLNAAVLQRMTDSALYGGAYAPAEMIGDLNDAVFGSDLKHAANAFRHNLQIAYLERLVAMVDDPAYDPTARAAALAGAENIRSRLGLFEFGMSAETKAHRLQVRRILARLDPD